MIIVITGPTCLGKSETAVNVALKFNAEIVNGDAFQAYKELNIGVAKPEKELMDKVPHHLYSFVEPTQSYSIMEYQKVLRETINEITSRGKNVVIVGGSGLYIRSALYDYEFKSEEQTSSSYDELTNDELFEKLKSIDPEEANKLHPNNRKRVLRAIQIFETQHMKKSDIVASQKHELIYKDTYFFVRDMDREILYERINKRVDIMMSSGLLDEAKSLYKKYDRGLLCLQAIGYKELYEVINNSMPLNEGVELIKKHTRNYAKRQMTFIRHQFPVRFYNNSADLIKIIENIK